METLALADESMTREDPGGWGQGKGASFQFNGTMAMCIPCGSILLLGTKISAYPNQENVHIKKIFYKCLTRYNEKREHFHLFHLVFSPLYLGFEGADTVFWSSLKHI